MTILIDEEVRATLCDTIELVLNRTTQRSDVTIKPEIGDVVYRAKVYRVGDIVRIDLKHNIITKDVPV
jgi:hypothetical protein